MNVGTYNIWCGVHDDGPLPWKVRCQRIAALIRFHDYDIIGMQEVRPEQMADLRTALPEFTAVGTGREGINQGEHSPVFFRTDRFALLDSGTFWLSETPEKVSRGWDADYNRICSWVKLRDRQSKKEFFYFNTHLDHMGPVARHEGAELICRRIASLAGDKYPVFCTGDFNAEPKDEPIKVMLQHLASARDVSQTPPYDQGSEGELDGRPGRCDDRHDPRSPARTAGDRPRLRQRPGVDVLKYGLLRDSDGINYPSDHIPILVRATLK
ncbi:MAG: endonuclease/exonuclease/phosphatase family protein [Alistipes indistinctus]